MPPGALSPHHLALRVRDLKRCEDFYRNVLGLELETRRFDQEKEPRAVWLKSGAMILMLERTEALPDVREESAGLHLFAFAIPRKERKIWRERLASMGIAIERESEYSLFLRDPEGNHLALSHYPEAEEKKP